MPTVNERCKILRSLNRVYVFEIVLLLVPRLKILRGLSIGILDSDFEKQRGTGVQSSSQETNHNNVVFAPTSRAADILPILAATPPGHRILLAANPSVLSEVLIGQADALHVRPLLPNLHAAYAPGTPVDPSVWDSQ